MQQHTKLRKLVMSTTIPLLNMDLSGAVNFAGNDLGYLQGDRTAIGDIVLMPLMLNYNVNPDLNINTRLALYAPTWVTLKQKLQVGDR